jgi:ABC-type branched-subunit amino acid transport system substrate-binding protein
MVGRTGKLAAAAFMACVVGSGSLAAITPASASAATNKAPITLALITSLTGEAGPQFSDTPEGFKARIALQNAEGGVNGHKIIPLVIDDQTSPTEDTTAVQDAISKGAFGIVAASPLFFEGAKYPQQAGIPVTGGSFDGPEWGEQPYTNMFASDTGSVDPKYPVSTAIGKFLKAHGGTVVGSYGYGISPSSARSAEGTADSFVRAGGTTGVLDTSVPFGSVDFTSAALFAKQKKVDAIYAGMDNNSNFALATALKQAGVKVKAVVFPTGFLPAVVKSPAWQNLQGDYFDSEFRPAQLPNAGTQQLVSALQKYEGRPPSQFPDFNIYESWLGADLMIKGLELAGANPTRANVIKDLRNLKSYNGNGLLPSTINYSTIFGHDLPKLCGWYMKAEEKGFVATSSQPVCGSDIPGTATATSS